MQIKYTVRFSYFYTNAHKFRLSTQSKHGFCWQVSGNRTINREAKMPRYGTMFCDWQTDLSIVVNVNHVVFAWIFNELVPCWPVISCLVCKPARQSAQQSYKDRPRKTPPWGLNARGVAKCSNVGPVEGYILEMLQDRASGTIIENLTRRIQWYHFVPSRMTPNKGSRPPILRHCLYL